MGLAPVGNPSRVRPHHCEAPVSLSTTPGVSHCSRHSLGVPPVVPCPDRAPISSRRGSTSSPSRDVSIENSSLGFLLFLDNKVCLPCRPRFRDPILVQPTKSSYLSSDHPPPVLSPPATHSPSLVPVYAPPSSLYPSQGYLVLFPFLYPSTPSDLSEGDFNGERFSVEESPVSVRTGSP